MNMLYKSSIHNAQLSVARKKHKPLMSLGLCFFFFYYAIHDFIHCGDDGIFQAYECPVLVQKSV